MQTTGQHNRRRHLHPQRNEMGRLVDLLLEGLQLGGRIGIEVVFNVLVGRWAFRKRTEY